MWTLFLVAIPAAIVWAQHRFGFDDLNFDPGPWRWAAFAVFWIAGRIGLWGGFLFATRGNGTPWPLDCTTRFLVLGPYRCIRNPMAACGILQGVMVGVWLGSPFVIAYALAGAPAWHYLARPWEEKDLLQRFSGDYIAYRNAVPLWIPTLHPYPATEVDHVA
jgi:protein-S-isoprenylcysteine O-methyltransferase Ste14